MDLFDLVATIRINLDEFDRGLNEARRRAREFSSGLEGVSQNISSAYSGVKDIVQPAVDGFKAVESVGKKAGGAVVKGLKGFAAASTAVGGFGAASVKAGATFDATMSKVSSISGATGKDFDNLRKKAIEMGAKTKFSASEAAEAMSYMGMAGWKTKEMLGGIEGIMNLAAASGEDLATTSDIVTDALSAFGMQANESGHFADLLAVASSNSNTDVGMMGETFKYVAPVMGSMGYTAEDAAQAIGIMANSGIKASQAGTTLRSIVTRLATDAGASSKSLGALGVLTQKLGVAFYDTDGSARPLTWVLEDMREAWKGLTAEEQNNYAKKIAGQEAISGFLAMMNAEEGTWDDLAMSINNCGDAAERMAAVMMDNLAGDMQILRSNLETLQITISDALTPTLREFAQFGANALRDLTLGFQQGGVDGLMSALTSVVSQAVNFLAEKVPLFVEVSGKFMAALANGILNSRTQIFESANQILITMKEGLDSWLGAHTEELIEFGTGLIRILFQGFLSAGELISEHIGQFIPLIANAFLAYHEALFTVGVQILGAIGRGLIENKEELQAMASETISAMVTALQENAPDIIMGAIALLEAFVGAFMENLPQILALGAELIGVLVVGITTSLPALGAAVGLIIPYILKVIKAVGDIGKAVEDGVKIVKKAIDFVAGGQGIEKIMSVGRKLMAGVKALFTLIAAHPIVAVVTAIIAAVVLLWNNCEEFREAVIAIWEAVKGAFVAAWEAIKTSWGNTKEFFSKIWEGIQEVFAGVAEFFQGVFEAAVTVIQTVWGVVVGFFTKIWEGIKAVFSVVAEVLGGFFRAAWEAIKAVWETVSGFFEKVGQAIHEIFETVTEFLSGAFKGAWEAIKKVWDAAKGFFSGIWDNIKQTAQKLTDFVGGAFEKAWGAVTRSWDGAMTFFQGIWDKIKGVFSNVWEKFKEIGGNIVSGLKKGIANAWSTFIGWITDKVGGLIQSVKNLLGIASPSKVFASIGGYMALGLGKGWEEEYAGIQRKIESGLHFTASPIGVPSGSFSSASQSGQSHSKAAGGDTYVTIHSPVAVDAIQAAREWKKTTQRMALGYV